MKRFSIICSVLMVLILMTSLAVYAVDQDIQQKAKKTATTTVKKDVQQDCCQNADCCKDKAAMQDCCKNVNCCKDMAKVQDCCPDKATTSESKAQKNKKSIKK